MRMLKLLGLTVFVVCIAAFASGCGGGGGGSSMDTETPTMPTEPTMPTQPTEPAEPTDEQRIAEARQLLATILTDAHNLAQTASSAAAAVQFHPDATAEQMASALTQADAAQTALAIVVAASSAGNAAATLAQAQLAVTDAQAALNDLTAAQSAAASIQSAVEAVASQRQQREADEAALTNNSSLIRLVRDNKLLSDAVLAVAALTTGTTATDGSIVVGEVGATARDAGGVADAETCTAPCAIFPATTGTGATAVIGQRTVSVQGATSDSKTTLLSGTGPLPHGFDFKNDAGTTYVNAYTDITQTRINVRTKTNVVEDTSGAPDDGTTDLYENRDFPDADYLLAGIWLTVGGTLNDSRITAFAYGSQPIPAAFTFCSGIEASDPTTSGTTTTDRNCVETPGVNTIEEIVDDGKDVIATYSGNANGAYIAGGDTGYFTASVELTAEFQNPTGRTADDNEGSIGGAVTNIVAGGQSMVGSIELQKQTLGNVISAPFVDGTSVGVVDGKSFSGGWKGQFFGRRAIKSAETDTVHTRDGNGNITATAITITTTYKPEAPGSVAGTFYATQQSNPAREAAFIGSFAAHR